jgi:hypothetical protein
MEKVEVRTQIQLTRGILDLKQMGLKEKNCSLAESLPLPRHHCRKFKVHVCFHFSPIEEYLVDRIAIGCMD